MGAGISRHEVAANDSRDPEDLVAIETPAGHEPPPSISRMSARKVKYLGALARLSWGRRTLELFGGSNLSTAVLASLVGGASLTSTDLRYPTADKPPTLDWWYRPDSNYRRHAPPGGEWPLFLAADATQLPFVADSFDVVIAPDSPRSNKDRFDEPTDRTRGTENGLTYDEQATLFLAAAAEGRRVLRSGGVFAATAPLSWGQQLWEVYERCTLISHATIDPSVVARRDMPYPAQFQTQNCNDPVVYVVCQA